MTDTKSTFSQLTSQLPLDRLKSEAQGLGKAYLDRGLSKVGGGVESLTSRLTDVANGADVSSLLPQRGEKGENGLKDRIAGAVSSGAAKAKDAVTEKAKDVAGGLTGSSEKSRRRIRLLEPVDVPTDRETAFSRWTEFSDELVRGQAQVFRADRNWESAIIDQTPEERMVWKSEVKKGPIGGVATFHEISPELTRILMALEYQPKGIFRRLGDRWRRRRARAELRHFADSLGVEPLNETQDDSGEPDDSPEPEETTTDNGSENENGSADSAEEE
jgi:hypothetical protein